MLSGSFRILSAFFQHRVFQVVDAINTHVMPLAGNCPFCQGQVDPVQSSRCTRFGSVQEPDRRRADYLLDGLWFLELGSAEACMLCLFLRGSICSQVVRRLTRYKRRSEVQDPLHPRRCSSNFCRHTGILWPARHDDSERPGPRAGSARRNRRSINWSERKIVASAMDSCLHTRIQEAAAGFTSHIPFTGSCSVAVAIVRVRIAMLMARLRPQRASRWLTMTKWSIREDTDYC